jgi:hypothetical protein
MDLIQLYQKTPVERHPEIVVSGNRLYFEGEEYMLVGEEQELKLIHSHKAIEERLDRIENTLKAKEAL